MDCAGMWPHPRLLPALIQAATLVQPPLPQARSPFESELPDSQRVVRMMLMQNGGCLDEWLRRTGRIRHKMRVQTLQTVDEDRTWGADFLTPCMASSRSCPSGARHSPAPRMAKRSTPTMRCPLSLATCRDRSMVGKGHAFAQTTRLFQGCAAANIPTARSEMERSDQMACEPSEL